MTQESATIEVPAEIAPAKPEPITVEQAQAAGMTGPELQLAVEHGVVRDPKKDEKKEPDNGVQGKEEGQKVTEEKAEAIEKAVESGEADKSKDYLESLSENERKFYWRVDSEKKKRQNAQAERDQVRIQAKALEKQITEKDLKLAEMEGRVKALESIAPKKRLEDPLGLLDEGSEDRKPETVEKPLTVRDLEEYEKKKLQEQESEHAKRMERASKINTRLQELESEGRARYSDFDDKIAKAEDIIKNVDKLYPEAKDKARITRRIQEALRELGNADASSDSDWNAADMIYELGTFHPLNEKPHSAGTNRADQGDKVDPDQIARIVSRRSSSASLNGGSGTRRVISVDDITMEEAARLSTEEFRKLPPQVRERLLRS
jgi:hypothetical protein